MAVRRPGRRSTLFAVLGGGSRHTGAQQREDSWTQSCSTGCFRGGHTLRLGSRPRRAGHQHRQNVSDRTPARPSRRPRLGHIQHFKQSFQTKTRGHPTLTNSLTAGLPAPRMKTKADVTYRVQVGSAVTQKQRLPRAAARRGGVPGPGPSLGSREATKKGRRGGGGGPEAPAGV